jgi:kojibiose phosphorylase
MNKKNFQHYLSSPEWLREEREVDPVDLNIQETLFSLSNGYVGSRGILEEIPVGTGQGTFFAGLFDPNATKVAEIVNAPNPFNFKIWVKDEKLDLFAIPPLKHQRILDIKRGTLFRQTIFKTSNNQHFDLQSFRFLSIRDRHIAVMQIHLTPLDATAKLSIDSMVDTSVTNHALKLNPIHFEVNEQGEEREGIFYTSVKTLVNKIEIAYGSKTFITINSKQTISYPQFHLNLNKNETAIITKVISFFTSKDLDNSKQIKLVTIGHLEKAVKKGFDKLLKEHISKFEKKWRFADITIKGDKAVQSALRFNVYQLLSVADPEEKEESFGPKGLTGEGYKGHVFWDSVLLLLCYGLTYPTVARTMLNYRYNRLLVAKESAKARGYKGAMFPWESADSGLEETPLFRRDFDGTLKQIYTGIQEQHITADIFYNLYSYFKITRDEEFMLAKGLLMAIEIARFWASRICYHSSHNYYEIHNVIGPDEFHEDVNNNAYTNALAAWTLTTTVMLLQYFKQKFPGQTKAILKCNGYSQEEEDHWQMTAKKIFIPYQGNIVLQFETFLKLKELPLPPLNEQGVPNFPKEVDVQHLDQTQFVKQPDALLLFYFFPHYFNLNSALENYHFYESRTLHKSSWSTPIHAYLAAQLGLEESAYHYLMLALHMDIKNVDNDTESGIHMAAVGGAWLAVVYGFCGIRVLDQYLVIAPKLPPSWERVKLQLLYSGCLIKLTLTQKTITMQMAHAKQDGFKIKQRKRLSIKINDMTKWIACGKQYTFNYDKKYSHFDYTPDHIPAPFQR